MIEQNKEEKEAHEDPLVEIAGSTSDTVPVYQEIPKQAPELEEAVPSSGSDTDQQEMLPLVQELARELSSLNEIVRSRLSYDQAKEEAFDRLYTELEELKRGSVLEQLRPLYMDLILLFDRIEHLKQEMESPVSKLLGTLRDELLEILYRREIEMIRTGHSAFDPTVQQAIGIETTDLELEDNRVTRVVRHGFRHRDRILRTEEVIVRKYRQGPSVVTQ